MALSWNQLNAKPGTGQVTKKIYEYCDDNCNDKYDHTPRCSLITLVKQGMSVAEAKIRLEESIKYAVCDNTGYRSSRQYNEEYASEEEKKRFRQMMHSMHAGVDYFCDCGAKHDSGGHYHWCTTRKEKKKIKLEIEDIPF